MILLDPRTDDLGELTRTVEDGIRTALGQLELLDAGGNEAVEDLIEEVRGTLERLGDAHARLVSRARFGGGA